MSEFGVDHPLAAAHGEEPGADASLKVLVELMGELVGVQRFLAGYGLVRTPNARRAAGAVDAVPATTSGAVVLLRANPYRRGGSIFNDSTANLFLKLGPAATADDFTLKVAGGGYYEPPWGYRGEVTGVWDAINGQARTTEFD